MILVTGAGGKIGATLIKLLNGASFRGAYNSPEKLVAARDRGLDAVHIDYARPETLEAALHGMDTVFLLSAGPGYVHLERNMVDAAKTVGIKRIVKLSAWQADKEPYTIAADHRAIERVIEASGIAWTFLRPNGFMQNYLGDAATIKTQNAFYRQAMDNSVSFIDARDIALAAFKALTTSGRDGKAYELSGPESLTNLDTANILARVLGKPITYVPVPAKVARAGMQAAGLPTDRIDSIENLMGAYETGIGAPVTPDLEGLIGRRAISFEQFVRDHIAAFQ